MSTTITLTSPAKQRALQRKYDKLREAAYQACMARSRLENVLNKLKSDKDWELFCKLHDVSLDTNAGDWMC